MSERVIVLGASPNPARYSNKALKRLRNAGHTVLPVSPSHDEIEGEKAYPDVDAVPGAVDTITVYLSPEKVIQYIPSILAKKPGRVILNPGAESELLEEALKNSGISFMRACTLVLLSTNQY